MSARDRWLLVVAGLMVSTTGCAAKRSDMLHFLREHEHEVSAIEYRVGIPDRIAISAPRVLEIDGERQRIQPDGKINLRLLGEIKIVGMTAKEIAAKLEVLLSRYYVDPKVSVRVAGYNSRKYYIRKQSGELTSMPYTGRDTLIDAIVSAGVDFRSWKSRVMVRRPAHGDTPVREMMVNTASMIRTGDWTQNILLEPDDIVVIPPTPGSWLAQRIREVLYPVGPAVQAYTAPASVMSAENAYDNNDDNNNNSSGYYGGGLSYGY